MRYQILCILAGAALALTGVGSAHAQSVDDLLQPGNKNDGGGGGGGSTTPPKSGPGPSGPTQRAQPTADDYVIATNRRWTTAYAIQRVIKEVGYVATVHHSNRTGIPYVRFKMEGKTIIVRFFGCSKHPVKRCLGILISTGYRMPNPIQLEKLNDWHYKRRYTYVYRVPNSPNIAWLCLDLTFSGGMTAEIFKKHLQYFREREAWFRKHIGFRL